MTSEAATTPSTQVPPAEVPSAGVPSAPAWRVFVELTKPRVTLMVVVTTLLGYLLASTGALDWWRLGWTLLGTLLQSAGSLALNQLLERRSDARMKRTAGRPLPSGRLTPRAVLAFGVLAGILGTLLLCFVNLLTAALGLLTLVSYVFIYTPMKPRSTLNSIVGAVPGAIPPMMGVTAVTNQVDIMAWVLFAILFLWQMPHFLAIAWLYREDYERGGLAMLPVEDAYGERTARQMMLWATALVPVSLLPSVLGISGLVYFIGALVLGFIFLASTVSFAFSQNHRTARRVLLTSVTYLPMVLTLMVVG